MFKILKSLSKSLIGHKSASAVPAKPGSLLDKVNKNAPTPAAISGLPKTAEELCEVTPKMSKPDIQARIKLLYRRYNHSAGSLDVKIRAEAETMLNAIVDVREKHFGEL